MARKGFVIVITSKTDPAKPDMSSHNSKLAEATEGHKIVSFSTIQQVEVVTMTWSGVPYKDEALIITTTLHLE